MKTKKINMRMCSQDILKSFRECKDTESVNLVTPRGYIYMAGGMLCKLEDDKLYFADKDKGRWILV